MLKLIIYHFGKKSSISLITVVYTTLSSLINTAETRKTYLQFKHCMKEGRNIYIVLRTGRTWTDSMAKKHLMQQCAGYQTIRKILTIHLRMTDCFRVLDVKNMLFLGSHDTQHTCGMATFDVSGQSYLIWYTHKYLH